MLAAKFGKYEYTFHGNLVGWTCAWQGSAARLGKRVRRLHRYCGVILPNSGGHSDEVIQQSKVAHSSICASYVPLPYRPYSYPLRWRHNGCDSVSNHQPHHCLLNRLFRRRSKKTSKLRVTGLCAGNSPGTGEFPAQMASYAENVSIWWRHHVGKIQTTSRLEILVVKPGNLVPWLCGESNSFFRTRNLFFDDQKCPQLVLTGVIRRYWHICGGPFFPGLPQGALLTQILWDPSS